MAPDIRIHKYAKYRDSRGDTQTGAIIVTPGEAYSYYYEVSNSGSQSATGVIVEDTFPLGVLWDTGSSISVTSPTGSDVTSDWICQKGVYPASTRLTLTCEKRTDFPPASGVYVFRVPVRLDPSVAPGTDLHNVVYVCASNDTDPSTCDRTPPPPPPPRCDATTP
jgi:uncharacterized repeat protein (TIGR01451 family)